MPVLERKSPPRLARDLPQARVEARIVGKSFFGEDVERPEILHLKMTPCDPVPDHADAGRTLDGLPRASQVFAELAGGHLLDPSMGVPFARHLVATLGDLAHHLGHLVRDPAEGEERRLHPELVEEVEGPARVALDAALEAIPLAGLDQLPEGDGLEVILDRDGEKVTLR